MAKSKSTAPTLAQRLGVPAPAPRNTLRDVLETVELAANDNARQGSRATAVDALRDTVAMLKALPDLEPAVDELQQRVWRLRSLIDCLQVAEESGATDDLYAAFSAVLELADSIHMALDFAALEVRAREIAAENARKAEIEALEAAQEAKFAQKGAQS